MLRKRGLGWYAITLLLVVGAAPFAVWAMLSGDGEPTYQTGNHQTYRGQIIPLPGERFWVAGGARYVAGGTKIFLAASGGMPAYRTDDLAGGYWLVDRTDGTASLIHDDYNGDLWWGASLCQFDSARPAPDGQRVAALQKCYTESARSIERDDPNARQLLEDAFENYEWLLVNVATGDTSILIDLTEEYHSPQAVWSPRGFVWLNSQRLAFARDAPDPNGTAIYTLDVDSEQIEQAIIEAPGSYVGHLRRVSDGKILYYFQTAEAVAAISEYMDTTPLEERDPSVVAELLSAETSLKLADLCTAVPSVSVLDFGTPEVDLRSGKLSPNERYYAFRTPVPGSEGKQHCLAIAAVGSDRIELLENEICSLCEWHPSGDRLLVVVEPQYPTDRPGALAEVPVADVCAALDD
jgi:hypothetical protein